MNKQKTAVIVAPILDNLYRARWAVYWMSGNLRFRSGSYHATREGAMTEARAMRNRLRKHGYQVHARLGQIFKP